MTEELLEYSKVPLDSTVTENVLLTILLTTLLILFAFHQWPLFSSKRQHIHSVKEVE